jgi:hypothetical protein
MPNRLRSLFLPIVVLAALPSARAQCQPQWLPGEPRVPAVGTVLASATWDPDGGGPLPPVLAVGGYLGHASPNDAAVATWNGSQWSVLGTQTGIVRAMAVHNGQLHVARSEVATSFVEVWNGAQWQILGVIPGTAHAMSSWGGQLVIGGAFASVSGVAATNVARWTGATWAPLGIGITGTARAFADFNGSLYVGGAITGAGSVAAAGLALWNGSSWSAGPAFDDDVHALAVRNSLVTGQSFLFAGGAFGTLTVGAQTVQAARVARFEPVGNVWTGVSGGLPAGSCDALLVRPVGLNGFELAAAGQFGSSLQRVHRLAGGTWSAVGTLSPFTGLNTLAFHGGQYVLGIGASATGPEALPAVLAWNGTQWLELTGPGMSGAVLAVASSGNDVVIGGTFTSISGVTVNRIARGGSGAWTPLGGGIGANSVRAVAIATNGDVIATGDFTTAGGVPATCIARWNGAAWSPLGSGIGAPGGYALLVLPGGDIVVGGGFTFAGGAVAMNIARWDGSTWSPLGAGLNARVEALALLPNGDIVAGGWFTQAGGAPALRIARFSGGVWSPLGSGCNGNVLALAIAPNGDLHAGGTFTSAGGFTTRLARWNGAWSPTSSLGIGADVTALHVHDNGDLFVGGEPFALSSGPFGNWVSNLVRIDEAGTVSPMNVLGTVVRGVATDGGDLVIGGTFATAGNVAAANVARFHAPCPATATPYGAGCSGLTAPLTLTALQAPWLGGAWRLRSATFAPVSFAVRVLGFAQLNLPLPPLLPGSLPGCTGLLTPDVLWLALPTQGQLTITTPVPSTPTLVGAQVFEQVLQFENAPGGFAISSSNGIQLVVGVL